MVVEVLVGSVVHDSSPDTVGLDSAASISIGVRYSRRPTLRDGERQEVGNPCEQGWVVQMISAFD
jgi:hypothetical protein